jgi:hypothetical protein
MSFVCNELANASPGEDLRDYVIAQVFGANRSAFSYESRGEAMASDLVDGETPEAIRKFRQAVLELRDQPNLVDQLAAQMPDVYGRVLPGYGISTMDVPEGSFMVIGPERQMKLYEDYLKKVEGPNAVLYRIYPRDFWIVLESEAMAP